MKKIINYILWIPFAVSIGSFVLYFINTIRIRLDKNIIITESIRNNLKYYLIIGLVSLSIGLFIIFIRKIITLFKTENNNKLRNNNYLNSSNNKTILEEKISSQNIIKNNIKTKIYKKNKEPNIFELKILNPIFGNNKITGIMENTNKNVEVYIKSEKCDLDKVSCPECESLISKDAAICPHCGILFDEKILQILNDDKIKGHKKRRRFKLKIFIVDILLILLFIFLIFLVSNLILNNGERNYNNTNNKNIVNKG